MTDLKTGVDAITIGAFERDIDTAYLLGSKSGIVTPENCKMSRATKGKSPVSSNDRDGIMQSMGNSYADNK
jgi:hypothetical protein